MAVGKQGAQLQALEVQPVLREAVVALDVLAGRIGAHAPRTHPMVLVEEDHPLPGKESQGDFDLPLDRRRDECWREVAAALSGRWSQG